MRAAIFSGPGAVEVGERPGPAPPSESSGSRMARSRSPRRSSATLGWRDGPDLYPRAARRRARRCYQPRPVFDYETDLEHIADAYRAMDERRAIKSLVRVGAI
jgi:hypothetical protein